MLPAVRSTAAARLRKLKFNTSQLLMHLGPCLFRVKIYSKRVDCTYSTVLASMQGMQGMPKTDLEADGKYGAASPAGCGSTLGWGLALGCTATLGCGLALGLALGLGLAFTTALSLGSLEGFLACRLPISLCGHGEGQHEHELHQLVNKG
jgi:hypothetical protein